MKKTLMITGASGFIGSNFIEKYKDEYNIIPVDLLKNSPEDLAYNGVDCILHLAALVHQMKGAPREKYFEVNTELTKRVAESAKKAGVEQFVFYSTVAVWGTHGSLEKEELITLNTTTNPKDPYGESKLLAEKCLQEIKNENFKIAIVRPPMVYGKNCPGNMKKLEKLVRVLPILPFDYNENRRSIVHVDKLLEITNEIIIDKKEGIYIPKDEKDISIKEIVEGLAKENNKKIKLIKFPQNIFDLLVKIKPRIMKSLYGSLMFKGEE